ncbi:MAG TPA: transcriptional regulator, partial [Bacteroidia bacterium]
NDNASDISADKGYNKATKKATGKAGEKPVIPSINNTNSKNNSNNLNEHEHKRTKNYRKSSDSPGGRTEKKEKLRQKKKVSLSPGEGWGEAKPTLKQTQTYFAQKRWPTVEAQKFFNYFQSNGWLVGGKTPMKNWKAAAKNWMLNSENFKPPSLKEKGGGMKQLYTKTEKNYDEPL